jgi:hypothetical protein
MWARLGTIVLPSPNVRNDMIRTDPRIEATPKAEVIYCAIEPSEKNWRLACYEAGRDGFYRQSSSIALP